MLIVSNTQCNQKFTFYRHTNDPCKVALLSFGKTYKIIFHFDFYPKISRTTKKSLTDVYHIFQFLHRLLYTFLSPMDRDDVTFNVFVRKPYTHLLNIVKHATLKVAPSRPIKKPCIVLGITIILVIRVLILFLFSSRIEFISLTASSVDFGEPSIITLFARLSTTVEHPVSVTILL